SVYILPYLELDALHRLYRFDRTNSDDANEPVRTAYVKVYVCPSDVDTTKLDLPATGPGNGVPYRRGSYRCVSGRSDASGWCDLSAQATLPRHWRGVLHVDGPPTNLGVERLATVSDGTAYTLMAGERATTTVPRRTTFWAYTYGSYNSSSAVP